MKRQGKLLLSAPVWRAWLETWLIGAVGLSLLLPSHTRIEDVVLVQSIFFLIGGATFWFAVRLRLARGKRRVSVLGHELAALASLAILVGAWWGGIRVAGWDIIFETLNYTPRRFLFIVIFAFPWFVASRVALYIWAFWLELRRRHLVWALTHLQLQLVLTLTAILSIVSAFVVVLGSRSPLINLDTWVRTILPFASVAGAAVIFTAVSILPPAALIAWLTARRTTRRLQTLTQASAALRDGDTTIRIQVDGEDEVAQLQEDFNAMAASLDRAMTALQAERDKVTALLKSRRQLIVGVSHELRTPLATLRGYLESIQQAPESAAIQHDLEVMSRELSRLQVLIDDLFTLSRAEVDALDMDLRPVDLREIVAQRVDAVAPLAWQRERVQVIADLPEALPPACADTVRVEQILVNLLRNALRHTPPGGIIIVSVATSTKSIPAEAPSSEAPSSEAPSGELCLRVCDTGEGIPEEDLAHVWERFYRGAGARSRDTQGAGLGLSLVKGLAEAMGGRVAVESEPGKDTCFYVWFPICS